MPILQDRFGTCQVLRVVVSSTSSPPNDEKLFVIVESELRFGSVAVALVDF